MQFDGSASEPSGGFIKYPTTYVMNVGPTGSWDDAHVYGPEILYDGMTYHMWYTGSEGAFERIGYATSPFGISWTKYAANPVLDSGSSGSWDDVSVRTPNVLYDGITYHMWFSGYDGGNWRIGYATSSDGITWTKHAANPVLDLGGAGSWDDTYVYSPRVLYDGVTFHMWFMGSDGPNWRIGYATSSDGISWTKHVANPVLDLGPPGSWDDTRVYTPEVLYDGMTYQMWYSGWNAVNNRIGYATSLDGVTWTKSPENPVLDIGPLGFWDDTHVAYPVVLDDGTEFKMWFLGGDGTTFRIGHATSPDGIAWTKKPTAPVLDLGTSGSWDDVWATYPSVIYDGSAYKMWYTGYDGNTRRIGYATSLDGIAWTKSTANPVLDVGSGSWEIAHVSTADVIYDGVTYHMWYAGYETSGIARIGYATSPDGIVWTKYSGNPVLDRGPPGSWDEIYVYSPSVIYDGSTYHMWFGGLDSTVVNARIGYATSPDGMTWTKNPANPVIDLGSPGSFDDISAYYPSVNYDGSLYKNWYSGYDGSFSRIGLATSPDGIAWTKSLANPVLDLGPPGAWDQSAVYSSTVLSDGGILKMWYGGNDAAGEARIGYAFQSDVTGIVSYTWDFNNYVDSDDDGNFTNDVDATGPTPTNVYGDNGVFTATLNVTNEAGLSDIDTCIITVNNVDPQVDPLPDMTIDEGDAVTFDVHATDPGSDDLTFDWLWEYAPWCDKSTTYLNNPPDPDPYPSPEVNPRNVTDSASCTYGDNGVFTVTLTVCDDDDGCTTVTTTVTVDNVIPTIDVQPGDVTIDEGGTIEFTGTATDPGSDDLTFSWTWEHRDVCNYTVIYYNNVSADPLPSPDVNPMNVTNTSSCTYGDDGNFTVTLSVTDDDGGMISFDLEMNVNNVAPIIDALPTMTIDEGDMASFTGHATDPGSDDLTFTWNWGYAGFNDTVNTYLNNPPDPDPDPSPDVNPRDVSDPVSQIYGDNGAFTVTLTVEDDDDGVSSVSTTLTVNNLAPQVDSMPDITINEGETVTFDAHATDVGSDDLTFEWTWEYRGSCDKATTYLNDPSNPDSYPSPELNPRDVEDSASCTYGDNGVYTVTLTVTDDDGGSTSVTTTLTVNNIAPTAELSVEPHWETSCSYPDEPVFFMNEPIHFEDFATDPGSDDLTFTWDFGDATLPVTATYYNDGMGPDPYPSPEVNPMSVVQGQTHIYTYPGLYTITVKVVDDDGGKTIEEMTIRVLGPMDFKLDAICELQEALELDPDDQDILDAIGYLYMSLGDNENATLWANMGGSEVVWGDAIHIDEGHGGYKGADVYQYEEEAMDKLIAYLENDENIGTGVASIIPGIFWRLRKADRYLTTTAIQDAIDAGGNSDDIAVALKLLVEADDIWNDNYPDDLSIIADYVLDKLEESWEKAVGSYCG
ncbi:MAG: PKD domain-containing protein [Thermoplasmata archaeon]|nr:PKD domain-containing protein [Thermoplasmata archaeon]